MTKKTLAKTKPHAKKKTTALARQTKTPWTQKQVELITRTVAKGATIDELHLFLYTANKVKLDPLAKQIHFTKYNTKDGPQMAVITGIDGYRAIAERSGTYAGSDDAIYDGGKDYGPGKEPNNPSIAAITVFRIVAGTKVGFTASARWKEYYPGDKKGFMWKKMPYLMLGKVAEALALRKAFPNDLSGIKTADEMGRAGTIIDVLPETPNNSIATPKKAVGKPVRTRTAKTTQKVEKCQEEAIEGEIEEEKYVCRGCDIEITKSDKELGEKLSIDNQAYCAECLKQYRK